MSEEDVEARKKMLKEAEEKRKHQTPKQNLLDFLDEVLGGITSNLQRFDDHLAAMESEKKNAMQTMLDIKKKKDEIQVYRDLVAKKMKE